jgi:hypothetical protein
LARQNKAWHELGLIGASDLNEERLQLHWAAQPLSAAAHAAIERLPDDSHANLGWDHDAGAFVTREFPGGHVAALDVLGFALQWRAPDGTTIARFELKGNTLEATIGWLQKHLEAAVGALTGGSLELRDYDMPAHPVADGQPFNGGDRDRRAELAHWFATADIALTETEKANEGSSEVRTWPHHFDTGLLINLEPDKDPDEARSIGVGLSPGDSATPQPYYYVNPYPRPQATDLPDLPSGGRWEQELFFGAVLTGDALLEGGDPSGQHERVRVFLATAVDASRKLLGL